METSPSISTPRLTAVVVTYQSAESIAETMASLHRSHLAGLLDCVVIDNNSSDSTLEQLAPFQDWARIVAHDANIGFGRGCNLGMQYVSTELVVFINPDSSIEPESIERLIRFMQEHPDAQLITPALTEPGGSVQGVGDLPTPFTVARQQFPLLRKPMHKPVNPGDPAFRTDWISGAILMGRTSYLRSLGGFDSRFFLYFEETDLCRRILNRGGEIWCVGEAEGFHIGAVSSRNDAADRINDCIAEFYYQSRYYYLRKHHGFLAASLAELAEVTLLALRGLARACLKPGSFNPGWNRLRAPILSLPSEVTEKYQVSVTTPEQLDAAHIDRWRQLQQADPDLVSPYFCPEFTCLAASVRDDIQVAVIYENDEIKGFFPFQKSSKQSAVPVAGPVSDYHGLVIEKGYPVDALHLLRQCGLKSWKFNHLIASQSCLQSYHQINDVSYLIDMSDGFEHYLESQRASGSKLVSSIGRKRRKLEREIGPIRFVYHSSDPAVLSQMFEWKSEQYRRTEKVDVFSFDWTRDLISAVWKTEDRDFAGVLSALYAGDVLVAVHMGMRSREVWHWWFPTYNPEFAKYSPGSVFLLEMAEVAATHGIKVIDLGKGESRYKDQFHNRRVELAEGSISLTDFRGKVSQIGKYLADLIRRTPLVVPARIPARLVRRYRKMKEFD